MRSDATAELPVLVGGVGACECRLELPDSIDAEEKDATLIGVAGSLENRLFAITLDCADRGRDASDDQASPETDNIGDPRYEDEPDLDLPLVPPVNTSTGVLVMLAPLSFALNQGFDVVGEELNTVEGYEKKDDSLEPELLLAGLVEDDAALGSEGDGSEGDALAGMETEREEEAVYARFRSVFCRIEVDLLGETGTVIGVGASPRAHCKNAAELSPCTSAEFREVIEGESDLISRARSGIAPIGSSASGESTICPPFSPSRKA